MKMITKPILLIFIFLIALTSCNDESIFEEPVIEVIEEETPEDTEDNDNEEDTAIDTSAPCAFALIDIQPNSTIIINCILDLGGESINLPESVTLVYEGGEIINGTINFSDNSIIDGNLLNNTLIVTGSTPQLKDPVFNFNPDRWGIVQGSTTSEIAQRNNDILESTMEAIKEFGINTFKIDVMDAYFEVGKVTSTTTNQNFYASSEAINVPSDFNLVMTDNTHLRVFPNNAPKYCLLALRNVSNVTVTGGNLYGDRDEHDYSAGGTQEWGHVMELHAASNSVINGVKMINGSGDGMKIHSLRFTFQDDYIPSNSLLVKNCTFDSNRRNNISVTDGFNITIENNLLLNAGIDTAKSTGTPPKFGIDVEAVRTSDGNGGYIEYEKAEHVFIRNNTERGSAAGAITVHIGNDVIIEGNHTERSISYTYSQRTKIINNTVVAPSTGGNTAIKGGKNTSSDSIFDNEISGNTIVGFDTGINVQNRDVLVYNNTITDFLTGIFPIHLRDSKIYNNTMSSDRESSKGIFINVTTLDGVLIENNDITAKANSIKVTSCNATTESIDYKFTIKNNSFKSSSYAQISKSKGINFVGNSFTHGIEVYDSQFISFTDNEISTERHEGIYLRNENKDITITTNKIDVASTRQCIKIDSSTSTSEVNDSNNNCIQ